MSLSTQISFGTTIRKANKVLVYRVGHLGDTIIALPSLRAVRDNFAAAHIALLANATIGAARVTAASIIPDGLVDEWLTYPSNDRMSNPVNMTRLLRQLRKRNFDTLVYLAPRLRTPLQVKRDLAFFRLSGIRNFIGHTGFEQLPQGRSGNVLPRVQHETDHLLHRLGLSGLHINGDSQQSIDLSLTETERSQAASWICEQTKVLPKPVLVGFGPGSKWPSKIWPAERFAELGSRLIAERNIFPVVFGGSEDRALADQLLHGWGRGANASGALTPRLAAAALSSCRLFVGNDTGTMHLAAAEKTPCVVLMSAQDWPGRWDPYGQGHIVLRREVPCAGCMLAVCEREGLRCLKEISVDEAFAACLKIIDRQQGPSRLLTNSKHLDLVGSAS